VFGGGKSNLKHNDDFMADGLNKLRSRAVLNCCGSSVSNVAGFLCRAEEKLLFLSEAQSQYLRPLPKKKPILLHCRNLLVYTMHGCKQKSIGNVSFSIRNSGKHTPSLTHSLLIILSRGD